MQKQRIAGVTLAMHSPGHIAAMLGRIDAFTIAVTLIAHTWEFLQYVHKRKSGAQPSPSLQAQ